MFNIEPTIYTAGNDFCTVVLQVSPDNDNSNADEFYIRIETSDRGGQDIRIINDINEDEYVGSVSFTIIGNVEIHSLLDGFVAIRNKYLSQRGKS